MATKRTNGEGSVYRDKVRGGWMGAAIVDGHRRRVRARTMTDVLVTVLDFAVRREAMASNPAKLAIVTPTAAAAQSRQALEHDDADALWRALDGERLGPLFRVMLATGLRPGEALGLCWDAV